MKKLFYILFFIFLFSSDLLYSLDPEKYITQNIHQVWQEYNGFTMSSIEGITQTIDGYLWFSTQEGLLRFDGINYKLFNKQNSSALKINYISKIYSGKYNQLFFSQMDGIIGEFSNNKIECWDSSVTKCKEITHLLLNDDNSILYAGDNGIFVFSNYKSEQLVISEPENNFVPKILCKNMDDESSLWVGTESGLYLFNKQLIREKIDDVYLKQAEILCMVYDYNHNLFVGASNGLYIIRNNQVIKRFNVTNGLLGDRIYSLCVDKDNNVWIGTDNGLIRYTNNKFDYFRSKDGLSYRLVISIFEDKEGSIWIGTGGGGINRLRENNFFNYTIKEGLKHDFVLPVYEDNDKNMWIGTADGGIVKLKDNNITSITKEHGLIDNKVYTVCQDKRGDIWIGTDYGLSRLRNGKVQNFSNAEGLCSGAKVSMLQDSKGYLWIGTNEGLSRYDGNSFQCFSKDNGLLSEAIRPIFESSDGKIWVGTKGGGLYRYDEDKSFIHYGEEDGLKSNRISYITQDKEGVMWIGTYYHGLFRFKDGVFKNYKVEDGLYNNGIFCLLEDDFNRFWITCNLGLFIIDKKDIELFDNKQISSIPYILYSLHDGLPSPEFNGGHQPPAWKDSKGFFWFSNAKGAVSINPNKIYINNIKPEVIIEEFKVNNISIDINSPIKIEYGKNSYDIRFTACSFIRASELEFSLILDGYDNDYKTVKEPRIQSYSNLSPGKYEFKISACNYNKLCSSKETTFKFIINPPYWQQNWFYSIIIIGTILFFLSILKLLSMKYKRKEVKLLSDKEKAEEASKIKTMFLANISHELLTPLNVIIGFCQLINSYNFSREEIEDMVNKILKASKHLYEVFKDILDLSRIESGKLILKIEKLELEAFLKDLTILFEASLTEKQIELKIAIDENISPYIFSDVVKLKQILINLISNALKFTSKGYISLTIDQYENQSNNPIYKNSEYILFSVEDTGIGIPIDKQKEIFNSFTQVDGTYTRKYGGAGLGLAISKNFVNLLGGDIWVNSNIGIGSKFSFFIKNFDDKQTFQNDEKQS